MNYMSITHVDQLNGSGNRVVLWLAGCSHHCKGCQNAYSWDPAIGLHFDDAAKAELFKDLAEDWCAGITFSGGDPLYYTNRAEVIELAKEIKEKFPTKTIWMYTGYCWNSIIDDPTMADIIMYADVVCDGPYVESLRDVDLHWVGSSNQHVINVKDRLAQISALAQARSIESGNH